MLINSPLLQNTMASPETAIPSPETATALPETATALTETATALPETVMPLPETGMALSEASLSVLGRLRYSQTKKLGLPTGPEADSFFQDELLPRLLAEMKASAAGARFTRVFEHYREASGIAVNRYYFKRFLQEALRRNGRAIRVPRLFYVRDDTHLVNVIGGSAEASSIKGQLLTLEMEKNKGGMVVNWPQTTECREGRKNKQLPTAVSLAYLHVRGAFSIPSFKVVSVTPACL